MSEKVDFDDYVEDYDKHLSEGTHFFSENNNYFAEYKVKAIHKEVRHDVSTILEFGCGTGRNLKYLKHYFPEATITATDISESSIDFASQNNAGVNFRVEKEGLELEPFDLIFVAGVFHHIPVTEREKVAELLASRLNPQGSLFIFEHNPLNPVTQKIVNDCPYDEDAELLKASELKKVFEKTPLRANNTFYNLFIPPKLGWLLPVERLLEWLPLGGQYGIEFRY